MDDRVITSGRAAMATYISLISYTDEGIRTIKESPRRQEAVKQLLRDLGGEVKEIYLTLGQYDLVSIVEAPSDEVMAKFLLAVGSHGHGRTTTLRAFPEPEYRRIVAGLP
jgi:uncharacterized protein with GYD domain